ncbi:hypothetical protein [Bacillus sp. 95MFCvi2.1]|uniref:hypothetical protein n=1 Tax=Bacillus sp. 95MFCvi2.1 TaxID=1151121 RepID=UPI0003727C92|nr:hypothetical protein [Bacillus sp. 95MFCvi2.1]
MLELKTYDTKELCEALNVKITSFKTHKEKFLKDYDYVEMKTGRSKSYQIFSYKEPEKSEFIQLCEQIAGREVKFPKEETAEKLIKLLFEDDWTIENCDNIGWEVPNRLERHTVGKYIELFREYKILPKKKELIERHSFDTETGELFSKFIDPNKYTYYKVFTSTEMREEITKEEWLEMHSFIREIYEENIVDQLELCKGNPEAIKEVKKFARAEAHKACVYEYGGVPRKSISKALTKEAYNLFSNYFKKDDATDNLETTKNILDT